MIEALTTPVAVPANVPTGSVNATHRAWGHTHQPWNDPPLVSFMVYGYLDASQKFQCMPSALDQTVTIADTTAHADYTACLNTNGHIDGALVVAAHQAIIARAALAAQAAA